MSDNYDDIINLPRPVSRIHTPMSMENRAAQFAPFAALTGHAGAIDETARLTSERIDLTPEEYSVLSRRLNHALTSKTPVRITYFVPDPLKDGGSYVSTRGVVRKIEETGNLLIIDNGLSVPLADIIGIILLPT